MSWHSVKPDPSAVTRIPTDRFARKLAEEHAERLAKAKRDEEVAALHASLNSTCQRDRSAVQAVADRFKVDPSTVYRWGNGEIVCRPLADFLDLLDAVVAAKGAGNASAFELAWLVYRRYLAPQVTADLPAGVECGASLLRETGEAVTALLGALRGATKAQAVAVLGEIDDVIRAAHLARRLAEAAAAGGPSPRRVEIQGAPV